MYRYGEIRVEEFFQDLLDENHNAFFQRTLTFARTIRISPSGELIAFVDHESHLWVSSIGKFSPTRIGTADGLILNWSPTRDVLVFSEIRDGDDIACVRMWSGDGTKHSQSRIVGDFPVWIGTALAFCRNNKEVWKYEFSSGKEVKIFETNGHRGATLAE